MNVPMTTEQVEKKGLTESDTCSWTCEHCGERVWYEGSLDYAPAYPNCPYCGVHTYHTFVKWAVKGLVGV